MPISIETRTGDTPANRRARQRAEPPNILLTTPESLAVLLSLPDAAGDVRRPVRVVMDEVHALAGTKRGDQLALCVARLVTLAPACRRVGLSATVAHPARDPRLCRRRRGVIEVPDGAPPELVDDAAARASCPGPATWGWKRRRGVMARIRDAGMTIVFVNTRAQAELMFQALWKLNEPTLPIALHHGSLEVEQRRKVEAAMAAGKLRAVVATSSLDLGIDWGGVDQVIQVGAPKGVSRLLQRVGRANHRMDEAIARHPGAGQPLRGAGMRGRHARRRGARTGRRSAAARRVGCAGAASAGPGVRGAVPPGRCLRRGTPRRALRRSDAAGLRRRAGASSRTAATRWRPTSAGASCSATARAACMCARERIARQHRMNIGTIVEAPLVKVRLVGKRRFGPVLGEVEEYFVNLLRPGDTFMFAGRLLRFLRLHENAVECAEGGAGEPMVPAYEGGRLPLTTNLADRVRGLLQDAAKLGPVSRSACRTG